MRIPGLSLAGKFNDWVMGSKENDATTLVLKWNEPFAPWLR